MRILPVVRHWARVFPFVFACFACGSQTPGSTAPSNPTAEQEGQKRSEVLASEGCTETGRRVELLDANGDQKPDIRKVFDGAHEVCRVTDLNHDGKPDLIEYFDATGNVRRREYCMDSDGQLSAIEYYDGGKLSRREYDTTHRHKIDTWDWFDPAAPLDAKTGRPKHPSHRERDTTGNGKVNEWWTWDGDKVQIAVDSNGDGKPDPASALTMGGDNGGGGGSASTDTSSAPPASSANDAGAAAPPAASATSVDGGSK
jgi:hypothetical protein